MSEFWTIVLDILIFIASLGVLIIVHEAGHLSMAKLFKVYCYEFSIGMGPSLFSTKPKKEKNQETVFSIRAFPVGGYVSMAGEDLEDAEGVDDTIQVPPERTLEGKSRWKQIIIMAAGVTMNFILGYFFLILDYCACPQQKYIADSPIVEVSDNSLAQGAGLLTGDEITFIDEKYYYIDEATGVYNSQPFATISRSVDRYTYETAPSDYTEFNHTISATLSGVTYNSADGKSYTEIVPVTAGDKREVILTYKRNGTEYVSPVITTKASQVKEYFFSKASWSWGLIGVSVQTETFFYNTGEGFKLAGDRWAYYCGAIFKGLGSLFTPTGIKQVSGIIGVFQVSTMAAQQGIATYLSLWGFISINLGIVNLLPFPGLDGWQILVTVVEQCVIWTKKGIYQIKYAKKDMPEDERKRLIAEQSVDFKKKKGYIKLKRIASTVGLILLLVLSAVLIIKDIIVPIGS